MLEYSNSGSSSNAPNQSSSVISTVGSDWLGGAWLVDCSGSLDFSSLVAGQSTSIVSVSVGSDGGELVASGSEVGAGCLASRCCWLALLSLAILFSLSCWNFLLFRARCASVLAFTVGTGSTLVVLGTVVGSAGVTGVGVAGVGVVPGGGGLVNDGVRLLGAVVGRCGCSRRWMSAVRSAQPRLYMAALTGSCSSWRVDILATWAAVRGSSCPPDTSPSRWISAATCCHFSCCCWSAMSSVNNC